MVATAKEALREALARFCLPEDTEATEEEKEVGSEPEEEDKDAEEEDEDNPPDPEEDNDKSWGSEMDEDEEISTFFPDALHCQDAELEKEVLLSNFNEHFPKDTKLNFAIRYEKLAYSSTTTGKTLVDNKEAYRKYMERTSPSIRVTTQDNPDDAPPDPSPKGIA